MSSTAGPADLDPADLAWAMELAASLVTTALAVSTSDDEQAEPIYAAARSQALSVRTDDGLGADRWLAAMFFVGAHAAALLRRLGRHEGLDPDELWQSLLLRRIADRSS